MHRPPANEVIQGSSCEGRPLLGRIQGGSRKTKDAERQRRSRPMPINSAQRAKKEDNARCNSKTARQPGSQAASQPARQPTRQTGQRGSGEQEPSNQPSAASNKRDRWPGRTLQIRCTPAGGAGRVGSLLSDSQNLKVQTRPAPAAGPSKSDQK